MSIPNRIAGRIARIFVPSLVVSRILSGRGPLFGGFFARVPHITVPALSTAISKLGSLKDARSAEDALVAFSGRLGLDDSLSLAGDALAAGRLEASQRLFDVGDAMPGAEDSVRARWLSFWLSPAARTARVRDEPPSADRVARLAVIDYRHPDMFRASINVGDWTQTTALLGNVARFGDVTFTGEQSLVAFADRLRDRVETEDRVASSGTLELSVVQRDVSDLDDIAPGTWLFAYGWYMWPRYDGSFDFPFHRNVLPIFLSFHCNAPEMLTADAVEYLREHGPVGCRDWNTVDLLLSRGVPAFFSGCVTSTLGHVVRRTLTEAEAATLPDALVDLAEDAGPVGIAGDADRVVLSQADADILQRPYAENLEVALELLDEYRDSFRSVSTSRLHCYLPCRAIGTPTAIFPPDPDDVRFGGLLGIDDDAFTTMADGVSDKLSNALAWIIAGESPEIVYARWGALCEADVAYAKARSSS